MRRLLFFSFVFVFGSSQTLPNNHVCQLRCIADCINKTSAPLDSCHSKCAPYDSPTLCGSPECWQNCNDLGPEKSISPPGDVKFVQSNESNVISWNPVPNATLYALQFKLSSDQEFAADNYEIVVGTSVKNFQNPQGTACDGSQVRVVAVSSSAVSPFSKIKSIDPPSPIVSPALNVVEILYIDKPFSKDSYEANGTLQLTFQFQPPKGWPLGDSDIVVDPFFHMVNCAEPDLSQAVPATEFAPGPGNTVVGLLGSDMMYRRCRFVYYVQTVSSQQCGTQTFIHSPPGEDIRTLTIGCDTVKNSPCKKPLRHEAPVCGPVDDFAFKVLNENVKSSDKYLDLMLNASFTPLMRSNEAPTLYYVAFYGPALNYSTEEERTFLGVNITEIMANSTNCYNFTKEGFCAHPTNNSLFIEDIHLDHLYGVTFCAVKDPANLTFPNFLADRSIRPKTYSIFVDSKVESMFNQSTYTNNACVALGGVSLCLGGDSLLSTLDDTSLIIHEVLKRDADAEEQDLEEQDALPVIDQPSGPTGSDNETISVEECSGIEEYSGKQENCTSCYAIEEENGSGSGMNVSEWTSTVENLGSGAGPSTTTILTTFAHSSTGLIVGVTAAAVTTVVIGLLLLCLYINKRQKDRNDKFRLKITQLEMEKENRYTEFPKKFDIWEIERRNLIIHNDKKLGSGAFGAVYLGKLLGKSLAHKDAQSPLGVNLMRAENCEVAVKMLPEYADELSKSEFLREIGLMKTLGYHERLVNMMASVTDSEPLCLVVEYCSDGDLLQFLRTRCKYMMKLDELGIDYHQAPVNGNYDVDMIITMKQLLMFAVQISYGLEYLSQKGFVHRDVAARNILVHNRTSCKIGDFGLCRYIYAENSHYKSKGGRLPLKWMSPEAIRHYEFSTQSDVWSFGILLFEVITLGGSPYPGVQPEDMLTFLETGGRMEQPDNCPDDFYDVMRECWHHDPEVRLEFSQIRQKLATQLEEVAEEYSYLKLDAQKDYYNVQYGDQKPDVIIIPDEADTIKPKIRQNSSSLRSVDSIPRDPLIFDPNDDVDRTKAAIRREQEEDTQSSVITDSISISMGAVSETTDV